jgi:hypothetical protein
MALSNTPFFPQNLASQETQTQTSRHLENPNRGGEETQTPVALHFTKGSFIHGGAGFLSILHTPYGALWNMEYGMQPIWNLIHTYGN